MSNITYYVAMGFVRDEAGELVAMDPVESQSSHTAVARARSLAAGKGRRHRFLARRRIRISESSPTPLCY